MKYNRNYYIKENEELYIHKGKKLFVNNGNFCYFNSILQCLFNCIELSDYFLSNIYINDIHSNGYTARIYNNLLSLYWKENGTIDPHVLLKNISNKTYNYSDNNQEDSHECLLHILECLHGNIDYKINISIKGEPTNEIDKLTLMYMESYKMHYENSFSKIKEMFNGMFINTLECGKCNKKDYNFEPFNNITLNISDALPESLSNFFSQKEINDYKCDNCKHKEFKKDVKIWSLPNNLILHLNKLDNKDNMNFPLNNLDLTKFISKLNGDFNNYIYDLYSVNFHKGNKNNGHFYSACKDISDNWILYDDSSVSKIHESTVLNTVNHIDAYILFYRRKFIKEKLQVE